MNERDARTLELARDWAAKHFHSRNSTDAWERTQEAEAAFIKHLSEPHNPLAAMGKSGDQP